MQTVLQRERLVLQNVPCVVLTVTAQALHRAQYSFSIHQGGRTRGLPTAVGTGTGRGRVPAGFREGPPHSFLEEQQHPQEETRGRGERSSRRGVFAHRPRMCGRRWRETAPLCRCCKPSIPGNPRPPGDQSACRRTWVLFHPPDTQHPPGLRTVHLGRAPAGWHPQAAGGPGDPAASCRPGPAPGLARPIPPPSSPRSLLGGSY